MQGFNMGRYRPPDSDPRTESFNGRTGHHALGKRARKLDDGILVVRFELPFNVWCDACEAHIGQGVRFNAQKSRVGAYYSTPIFRFRCKKTCCATWMEIETDPKNTRYVVVSGARQQNSEWDPAENGGFPVYDDGKVGGSSKDAKTPDAFAALEQKVLDKQRAQTRSERLAELEAAASARSVDPYTLNVHLRTQFRREKRKQLESEARDEEVRARIGWRSDRQLLADDAGRRTAAKEAWNEARDRSVDVGKLSIQSSQPKLASSRSSATASLAARVIANTRRKTDPFRIT